MFSSSSGYWQIEAINPPPQRNPELKLTGPYRVITELPTSKLHVQSWWLFFKGLYLER